MSINDFSLADFSLEGKTALVSGGNTGLGQAFSLSLAKAGANVVAVGMDDDNGQTKALVEGCGAQYLFVKADITKAGTPSALVTTTVERFGHIDVLVNCAGISILADVEEFGRQQWDAMVAVNLTAAFELSHAVAPHMIKQKSGKIINICSLFSFLGGLGSPAYAATKHGIAGLTKSYCDELAKHNIQVNGIAPGYFATAITENSRNDPEISARILDHIPTQRWGEREDLMGALVFLASKASNYVNGHILTVDGGYLVR